VLLLRVRAAPDQCLTRIRTRDASIHIPFPRPDRAHQPPRYKVALPWMAEIDTAAHSTHAHRRNRPQSPGDRRTVHFLHGQCLRTLAVVARGAAETAWPLLG